MNPESTAPIRTRPAFFFAVALGWSWLCWIPAAAAGLGTASAAGLALALLGLLGPFVAAITGVTGTPDPQLRQDYWRRLVEVRRIPVLWAGRIVAFVPVLFLATAAIDRLAGGHGVGWEEPALRIARHPAAVVPFVLGILLVGPMEEFGWRGWGLDRLQERMTPLAAGITMGCLWSLWHLPLFFIPGTYQRNLGVGTPGFWLFFVGIIPLSVVFSWIHNHTGRSTLAAMLFHFTVNATGELVAFDHHADVISIALWFLAAALVSGRLRPRNPPSPERTPT